MCSKAGLLMGSALRFLPLHAVTQDLQPKADPGGRRGRGRIGAGQNRPPAAPSSLGADRLHQIESDTPLNGKGADSRRRPSQRCRSPLAASCTTRRHLRSRSAAVAGPAPQSNPGQILGPPIGLVNIELFAPSGQGGPGTRLQRQIPVKSAATPRLAHSRSWEPPGRRV